MAFSAYFTEASAQKYLFYFGCLFYVVCTSIVVVVEPFLSLPCRHSENHTTELEFENILFRYDPCDDIRQPALLFFTRTECERGRHLLMAVFLGSLIGYERRSGDRPAGIRTMSLVSLGSALFTINSTFAFLAGPMAWDASRVSAAIPSGVGFLGAGLIVKSSDVDPVTGERHHLIQGITTAAATWVSAAVGLACGGGLYFTAIFATCLNLVLLRFGPRATGYDSESGMTGYGSGDMNNITGELVGLLGTSRDVEADAKGGANYPSYQGKEQENSTLSSRQLSMGSTRSRQSIRRNKPSLLAV